MTPSRIYLDSRQSLCSTDRMDRLIFIIGIDRYRYPEKPLIASVQTMQTYADYFRSAYGGQATTIVLLSNEKATRTRVFRELERHSNQDWAEVIFIFIGHGAPDGIGLVDGLMGYTELATAIRRIPTWHPLLILDTCHAGGAFSKFGGIGDLGESSLRTNMYELLARANPDLRILAAVPIDASTWQTRGQSVFSAAILKAARSATPDMAYGAVSAARIFALAARQLVNSGYECPVSRGSLTAFPFGFSDVLHPFGNIYISDLRPFESYISAWNQLHWNIELNVLIRDRALIPTRAQHFLHNTFGTTYTYGPLQTFVPTEAQETFHWTEAIPSAWVPWNGACSTVLIHDAHGRLLARQDAWWHPGMRRFPLHHASPWNSIR